MVALLKARRSLVVAFLSSVLFIFGYTSAMPAAGQSSDCDDNAVIRCGVSSPSSVAGHWSDQGVSDIYSYFGISKADVSAMGDKAQIGDVYTNGDVKVQTTEPNGTTGYHLVATDAMTAGRQDISCNGSSGGSTKVSTRGTTFYVRSPSVSFCSNPLTAYVMMKNDRFDFAIIPNSANRVKANPTTPTQPPTPPPTPSHQPTPTPQPQPTPPPPPMRQPQAQTQSQT